MKNSIKLILISLLLISSSIQRRRRNKHRYRNKNRHKQYYNAKQNSFKSQQKSTKKYSHYVWAVQWSPNICNLQRCSFNTNKGKFFNIHGLWPSNENSSPHYCQVAGKINWNKLDGKLVKDLDLHWAGLFSSRERFNQHEWEKHGTCFDSEKGDVELMPSSGVKNVLEGWRELGNNDQFYEFYFKLCIELNKFYDFKKIFKEFGIESKRSPVHLKKFENAIKQKFGIRGFKILCTNQNGGSYLREIRVCMNENFRVVDCSRRKFKSNCSKKVYYN